MAALKRPNILFIMTDQQRYDCLGCNGNRIIKTPNIDRLARESANFSSFFVQAPLCVPSRQTYFTGRYPRSHKNRVNYTSMDGGFKLLQSYLQEEGYKTGFVGKLHYFPPTREYALSTGFDYGLLHDAGPTDTYSDYVAWLKGTGFQFEDGNYRECKKDSKNPHVAVIPEAYHETTWCGAKTREMLVELSREERPFFLFSSYWRPHSPFEVPGPWANMYDDAQIELPERVTREYLASLPLPVSTMAFRYDVEPHKLEPDKVLWNYRAYYAAISQIDHEVGRTLEELDMLGLSENTIVVFCSDHGDFLHEHGMIEKVAFFEGAIHVPFIIRYPGSVTPGLYDQLIESTDVFSTLFDLGGLEVPYSSHGRSFADLITGGASGPAYEEREYVFAESIVPEVFTPNKWDYSYRKGLGIKAVRHPDAKMVRSRRWKYNYYVDYEELYDLENDPGEMTNLADSNEFAAIKEKLRKVLLDWMITADESDQVAPFWYAVRDEKERWVMWEGMKE